MIVEKILSDKFNEILKKHGNERWATNELEWLVYDKYRHKYEQLDSTDRQYVDHFFSVLRKLFGYKLDTDI